MTRPLLLTLLLAGCPEPPTPCIAHVDCENDQFCANESFCLDAFDREYAITLIGATVPPTGTAGGPWDAEDESDPDLVAFYGVPPEVDRSGNIVEPGDVVATDTQFDTTTATWNETHDITLESRMGFAIEIYDQDPNDQFTFIGGWFWETDRDVVDLVRGLSEDQEIESGTLSAQFRFDPP